MITLNTILKERIVEDPFVEVNPGIFEYEYRYIIDIYEKQSRGPDTLKWRWFDYLDQYDDKILSNKKGQYMECIINGFKEKDKHLLDDLLTITTEDRLNYLYSKFLQSLIDQKIV